MRGILEENRRLKEEVKLLEDRGREVSPFATPDRKQALKLKEAERPPKDPQEAQGRLQVQRRLQIQRRLLIDPQRKALKCCPKTLQSKSFSS